MPMPSLFTYTVSGSSPVFAQVISSWHSVSMKVDRDVPELARCCLRKTPKASWAPEAPDRSERTSSFDGPSNRLRHVPASILPGNVSPPSPAPSCLLYSRRCRPARFVDAFSSRVQFRRMCAQQLHLVASGGYRFHSRLKSMIASVVKQCFIFCVQVQLV